MAFRSRISPFVRSSLSVFRTPAAKRTLTSHSKESASYFRFAGPFVIGASAATAGFFAASRLYNQNFTLFENVHAATKVGKVEIINVCNLIYIFIHSCLFYIYIILRKSYTCATFRAQNFD